MKKKRLTYLDAGKGLAILLVVIGHTFGDDAPMSMWFYSFHMPMFFIISGCVLKLTDKKDQTFKEFIKSRALTLILPYFIFAVPLVTLKYAISSFDTETLIWEITQTVTLVSYSSLWFLPALFFAEIGFFMYKKLKFKIVQIVILCLNFIIPFLFDSEEVFSLLWLFLRASVGMGFLIIGYYAFEKINNSKKNIIIPIVMILPTFILCQLNESPDLFSLRFGDPILYLINGILGSIGFIMLFRVLEGKFKFLESCGKNSLIIMGTHELFLETSNMFLEMSDYDTTVFILGIAALVIGEIIIVYLINKFGAWPIGKRKGSFFKKMYPSK